MPLAQDQAPAARATAARAREYAAAISLALLALAARAAFPGEESLTSALLLVAVLLAGSYGGIAPGLVSGALASGGLLALQPPSGTHDLVRLVGAAVLAAFAAIAAGTLRAEYQEAVRHRERAERSARTLAESQAFTAHLAAAHEPGDVDRAVLEKGLPTLGATGAIVARAGRGALEVTDVLGYPPDVMLRGSRIPVDGRSPLAEAFRTRQALWISDAGELDRRFPGFAAATAPVGRGAVAAIPIAVGGACTGAIALAFPSDRPFAAEDRSRIVSLVTTAGQVFERARLLEDVARERARAELLASMAADLNRGTELDDVIRTALVGAARLLRGDDGALYLLEGDHRHLRGIAEVRPEQRTGTLVDLERMPGTRRALDAGRARFFTRAAGGGDAEWLDRFELTGSIVAPLLQGDRRFGVLYVNYLGLSAPEADELVFADAIAAQCALAISRAQAFETERRASLRAETSRVEAQAAAERVGRLQEITAALSSAVTMKDVAQVLFATSLDQLGARAAGIVWMVRPGKFELVFGHHVSEEEFRLLDDAARRGERLPIGDAIVSRRPIWLESPEEIRERYPVLEPLRVQRGEGAVAVIPLVVGSRCAGIIGLTFAQPRKVAPSERAFTEAVAQLAAQAFERARLYEAERGERARAAAAEEEAKQTARVQEQLMAVVGHDLRTPLSAIAMGAQLMARRGGLAPEQARVLSRIQHSAQRSTYIIRDLLDYSRHRRGVALPIHKQRIRVTDVCERTVLEEREVHRDVEITLSHVGDTAVDADAARVAQVVSNLVGNAIQHGRGAAVEVRARGTADEVVIEVHNEGPPIPPGVLPRMFEPFQRDAADDAGALAGSVGLGLFIVREIVTAHGGRVEVSSGPERGTTFAVHLPRAHD